ncbi:thioesterase, partial [Bacillus sp. SIMBA_031]
RAPSSKIGKIISDLSDDLFWQEVIKLGGIPDELKEHSELMEFYIPILKADFEVVYSYNHIITEKLDIPIDVFFGTKENATEFEITEWEN